MIGEGMDDISKRLLLLQTKAHQANQRKIRMLVSAPRRYDREDLERYERELEESIPRRYKISTVDELKKAIRQSNVVLVGDYHTLDQSQRGFLRILRLQRSSKVAVALEFVHARYQRHVDDYLKDRIDDETFLRRIAYKKAWASYQVWPNFKPIFSLCKARGNRIVALDCDPMECLTVFSRAGFAGWRVVEVLRDWDVEKVFVLMGEAHMAPTHLPQAIEDASKRLGIEVQCLVIHQILDKLWFDLVEKGIEGMAEVVKLQEDRFYVPASSPIVAQQSFLAQVSDERWALYHDDLEGLKTLFQRFVRDLIKVFSLPCPKGLQDIVVFGPNSLSEISQLARTMPEEVWQILSLHIEMSESLAMPQEGFVYLSELTPTHIAEEASHTLKILLAGSNTPSDPNDFLYSRIMHEVIGYFGSKVFNPKRKPPSISSLLKMVKKGEMPVETSYALLLAQWHKRNSLTRSFKKTSLDTYLKSLDYKGGISDLGPEVIRPLVHLIGYELGEKLYIGFRKAVVKRETIRAMFTMDFEQEEKAFEAYILLSRTLLAIRLPSRL
jgi:hypothetical protein